MRRVSFWVLCVFAAGTSNVLSETSTIFVRPNGASEFMEPRSLPDFSGSGGIQQPDGRFRAEVDEAAYRAAVRREADRLNRESIPARNVLHSGNPQLLLPSAPFDDGTRPTIRNPPVEVSRQCIARFDGIPQLHSAASWIEARQVYNATWKKEIIMKVEEHCYEMVISAPVSFDGIVEQHMRNCIEEGKKAEETEHILALIVGLYTDFHGGQGGASITVLVSYAKSIARHALLCLKDRRRLIALVEEEFVDRVNATVVHNHRWRYWTAVD